MLRNSLPGVLAICGIVHKFAGVFIALTDILCTLNIFFFSGSSLINFTVGHRFS